MTTAYPKTPSREATLDQRMQIVYSRSMAARESNRNTPERPGTAREAPSIQEHSSPLVTSPLEADMTSHPSTTPLLPCPFCGREPILSSEGRPQYAVPKVGCPACNIWVHGHAASIEFLWTTWNRRASAPDMAAEIERLRAALEQIAAGLADTKSIPGKWMTRTTKPEAYEIARTALGPRK